MRVRGCPRYHNHEKRKWEEAKSSFPQRGRLPAHGTDEQYDGGKSKKAQHDALKELGPDYDETEVRLVRIKFLCEVAN